MVPLIAGYGSPTPACGKPGCGECLYQVANRDIPNTPSLCEWCRDINATAQKDDTGTCYDAKSGKCNSPNVTVDGKSYAALVTDATSCTILTARDIMIAAIAGGSGGLVLFAIGGCLYYRKKRKRAAKLKEFQIREEDELRNKRLDLDRDVLAGGSRFNDNIKKIQNRMRESACANDPTLASRLRAKEALEMQQAASKRRFQVLSENGLRVREFPSPDAAKLGGLAHGAIVTALSVKGLWCQVSESGWAMIESADGSKLFLQELPREDQFPEYEPALYELEPEG